MLAGWGEIHRSLTHVPHRILIVHHKETEHVRGCDHGGRFVTIVDDVYVVDRVRRRDVVVAVPS